MDLPLLAMHGYKPLLPVRVLQTRQCPQTAAFLKTKRTKKRLPGCHVATWPPKEKPETAQKTNCRQQEFPRPLQVLDFQAIQPEAIQQTCNVFTSNQ